MPNQYLTATLILTSFLLTWALEQPTLQNLQDVPLDFDTFAYKPSDISGLSWGKITGNFKSTGNYYSAYYSTFSPSFFSYYPATHNGCLQLVKTSKSSTDFGCDYAINAGFFTWDITVSGSLCIGNLISDGKVWQLPTDGSGTGRANYGITADNTIVSGFINSDVIANSNFTQLITGWGWLVRNGESYVAKSADLPTSPTSFTYAIAPRTVIGHFRNGTMIFLQYDGQEGIQWGPTLYEAAEVLVEMGVYAAVNLDGGGSSVSVYKGAYIDFPTSTDKYPEIVERDVASFACVRNKLL